MSVNQVNLAARIISDISLRSTTKRGVPVADFRVSHRNRKLAHPLLIDVEVWGAEAQRLYENMKRGDFVMLVGELRRDVWTSKTTKEPRSKIKVTAERVVLMDSPIISKEDNEDNFAYVKEENGEGEEQAT